MEVGDQRIHRAERIARRDEQPRLAAVRTRRRRGFQRAHNGRAHGDHAAPAGIDRLSAGGRNRVAFLVHPVPTQVFLAHRLERARAHVQGERHDRHALAADPSDQILVEMQPGRGCRHCPRHARVHRLVTLLVFRLGVAVYIGRQRNSTVVIEKTNDRGVEVQQVELADTLDDIDPVLAKLQEAPGLQRLADPNLAQRPAIGPTLQMDALDEDLGLTTGVLARHQPGLDDAAVVDHEDIVGTEQIDQRFEPAMTDRITLENQEPTRRTLGQRGLGDQRWRQVEAIVRSTASLASHSRRLRSAPRGTTRSLPTTRSSMAGSPR